MKDSEAPRGRARLEAPMPDDPAGPSSGAQTVRLYDAMAPDYDASFDSPTHRRAYDLLAGEYIDRLLPRAEGVIVDVGCGTGRWAERWIASGRRVIGVERSPAMVKILIDRRLGPNFTLVENSMEATELQDASADLVVAMGSVQYASDPARMIAKFAQWAKPGGFVCVYLDSLLALALELLRLGRPREALERLATGRGVLRAKSERAGLALYSSDRLKSELLAAGLCDVQCRGLLITSSVWGAEGCAAALQSDSDGLFELERQLSEFPLMADAGRHIIAWGRRPRA